MPSASDVAAELINSFDDKTSQLLEDAIFESLVRMGLSRADAAEAVDRRYVSAVRTSLDRMEPQVLPFEISIGKPDRLVGKRRPRRGDTPQAARARERRHLVDSLAEVLSEMSDAEFEHLCAAVLLRNGASDARVLVGGNEGGVDFFGRIPVLLGDPGVPRALVRSSLEVRDVLFLGQAKRYSRTATINRDELQKFAGQIRDCLRKYSGMIRPPSNHVPFEYYSPEEPCLGFFLTSAGFSAGAKDYASSVNMVLGDGRLLAELLTYWGAAELSRTPTPQVVQAWSQRIHSGEFFAGP